MLVKKYGKKIVSVILISFFNCLIINSDVNAQAQGFQFDTHEMHWEKYWARALFDRNLVNIPIWNIATLGDHTRAPGKQLTWPGSNGLSYGGNFDFFMAALVTDMTAYKGKVLPEKWDGEQIPIMSISYLPNIGRNQWAYISQNKTHYQIWQPVPGFFNDGFYGYIWGIDEDVNQDGLLSPSEDFNFNGLHDRNLDPPDGIIKSLAISTDPRTWPEYWPGGSYIGDTRPYAGKPPRTSFHGARKGLWNGEYKAGPIADQETMVIVDDHENDRLNEYFSQNYWPMLNNDGTPNTFDWAGEHPDSLSIAGMGVEVEARSYSWFHPLTEDLLVSVYRVRNFSDHNLDRIVTGMLSESNIAGQGTFNATEFILPYYPPPGASSDAKFEFSILYQWHTAPQDIKTYKQIGFFGFAFLESPGIEDNDIDDDKDGIIDETQYNNFDDDGDWLPFDDSGLKDISGTAGNGEWDTEDKNLNGALDRGEDLNKNDKLDFEFANSDVGTDGIGPGENKWPGPDPDGSETNGMPDPGEPEYDETDIDEADQAGLAHVYVEESDAIKNTFKSPKDAWERYLRKVDDDPTIEETVEDISFIFGAKDVKLESAKFLTNQNRLEWKRFTIALIMGGDKGDIIRNKTTMQQIYDNNYSFLQAPDQPNVVSNVTDGKVQLYWDSDAENSVDKFLGKDFNGYRVYKSSDPDFLDIKTISDAFGNPLMFEPLEIFDYADGLTGPHPIPLPGLGVSFDMGNDVGLKHSLVDTLVENGRTYYYGVTAFDAGNDVNFEARGLVERDYPIKAMPSESAINITVNDLGHVVFRDRSTAVCIPVEPAYGYTEPNVDSLKIDHIAGFSRGNSFFIDVFNKERALEHVGEQYEITFKDDAWMTGFTDEYDWGSPIAIICKNLTSGDTLFNISRETAFDIYDSGDNQILNAAGKKISGFQELETKIFDGLKIRFDFNMDTEDKKHGISIIKYDELGRKNNKWLKWATPTKSNIKVEDVKLLNSGKPIPGDFELRVYDHIVDTSYKPNTLGSTTDAYPLNFAIWDVTDPNDEKKVELLVSYIKARNNPNNPVPEEMFGQIWDSLDITIQFPKNAAGVVLSKDPNPWPAWQIRFRRPEFARNDPVVPPAAGDVYKFKTERGPTHNDVYRFKIEGGEFVESKELNAERNKIFVVPDPYIGANTLESIYSLSGNPSRRVDFVNLPPNCTIYIYTVAGKLVKRIYHDALSDMGRHSWDLTSDDGPEVAFGMYFFAVTADGFETQKGKFALIK
ncbi:MAG: hypothetical protein GY936_02095 [Ignavibacteriae bacterium]|nr:hypothetical protein [Ignavibacteriota bacterium]